MARRGKKYKAVRKNRPTETMPVVEGLKKLKTLSTSAFKGSVELHIALNLPKDKDPKSLKGSVSLPHSTSNADVKIVVFTNKDNEKAAVDAGAVSANLEELVASVKKGKIDFDVAIATPDVMAQIASLGKELGPRGLMPNPKTGTVTDDFAKAIDEYKKGKMTFVADSTGGMHFKVGTVVLEEDKIVENIKTVLDAASDVVGRKVMQILKSAYIAPTMGPSIKVDLSTIEG